MFDLDSSKIESAVAGFQVPVKPEILDKIQALVGEPEPDVDNIATVISQDVGMSAAILKVINSPFYGMNRVISEIKQAVMMLGLTTINSLVTSLCLKESFKGQASISLERFWDDSTDVANAITYIGSKIKKDVPADTLHTLGLFRDCGIPLLALKYKDYKDVLTEANKDNSNSVALEEKHYNTNHAVLGFYVASSWYLPKNLCEIILRHHDVSYLRQNTGSADELAFAALKAAENMVERAKRFKDAPDWDEMGAECLNLLSITADEYRDMEDDFAELV